MRNHPVRTRLFALLVALTIAIPTGLNLAGDVSAGPAPVWVNDVAYGSRGGGFYHDFVSGLEWTAERGWHAFSPQPARGSTPPMWVNHLSYGSAGGGFYLDVVSGLVWTAERDWHS